MVNFPLAPSKDKALPQEMSPAMGFHVDNKRGYLLLAPVRCYPPSPVSDLLGDYGIGL